MDVPPKTPSPGLTLSPIPAAAPRLSSGAPPLTRAGAQPKPSAAQHQSPRPPTPAAPRYQMVQPQRAPPDDAFSSPPSGRALYSSELPWWTTDAEVEAALRLVPQAAPALGDLFFYYDKYTGKSRGICRAEFLSSVVAAATLHGHAFHGRNCIASLSTGAPSKPPGTPPVAAGASALAVAAATRRQFEAMWVQFWVIGRLRHHPRNCLWLSGRMDCRSVGRWEVVVGMVASSHWGISVQGWVLV
jgi:hypothetical protein